MFSGPMVQAILEGRKTQTRRLVKFHKPFTESRHWEVALPDGFGGWIFWDKSGPDIATLAAFQEKAYPNGGGMKCPYGQKGDHLWIKETHYLFGHWVKNGVTKAGKQSWRFVSEIIPSTTEPDVLYEDYKPLEIKTKKTERGWVKRPSLFMPRHAARLLLEITEDPHPERLQQISEQDAKAEGCHGTMYPNIATTLPLYTAVYQRLWDSINGKPRKITTTTHKPIVILDNSWASNPWVWVVPFKQV